MSQVLKTLKLTPTLPVAIAGNAKDRARAKVIAHLEQQKLLLAAHIEGKAYSATRDVYRTNEAGERARFTQPVHIRAGWFSDNAGTVHFMLRYGSKPLKLDKSGACSVEVGKLDALPSVIDILLSATRAGELDAQLAIASAERGKAFKRKAA